MPLPEAFRPAGRFHAGRGTHCKPGNSLDISRLNRVEKQQYDRYGYRRTADKRHCDLNAARE